MKRLRPFPSADKKKIGTEEKEKKKNRKKKIEYK